jgi:hypothetical protein
MLTKTAGPDELNIVKAKVVRPAAKAKAVKAKVATTG